MGQTDVLVIGGGIVGMCAAIALAEAGTEVTIVDAAMNAGSTANAGSLHVQMQSRFMRYYPDQVPYLEASLPFYVAATKEWERLDRELGPLDLVRKGGLMLAEDDDQMRFLEGKAAREERKGLKVEILDRPALDRIAPFLGSQIVGAELCHDEGKVNPLAANIQLRARADALGIEVQTGRIAELQCGSSVEAHIDSGEIIRASQVIIAAAWGSSDLVASFSGPIPTRAEPLHMNITEPGAVAIRHLIQHAERSLTFKQFGSGQIVIGGGWAAEGRGRNRVPGVFASSILGNVALAAQIVPSIAGLRVIRTWAGMNTATDGKSILGRLRTAPNAIIAVPGDAGYTLGPLVARLAADIVLERPSEIDPGQFSPDRFNA